MTPPEFSVLLLAWDDADPSVAVLGGAALPPTLPLVYQLAAQQPILAVYPHLPPQNEEEPAEASAVVPPPQEETPAPTPTPTAEAPLLTEPATEAPASSAPFEAAAATPGVRVLPAPAPEQPETPTILQRLSRIIGLDELPTAGIPVLPSIPTVLASTPALRPPAPARSQWPSSKSIGQPRQWLAPAAPYEGASPNDVVIEEPSPAALPPSTVREAADLPHTSTLALSTAPVDSPPATRELAMPIPADNLSFDPEPELLVTPPPPVFSETTEEMEPAEANDLSAPEDDITPEEESPAPVPTSIVLPPTPPEPEPVATPPPPVLQVPALDGLNFRMIQYARQAVRLVRGRSDFGVIYAPNWPAWLAALEIRNSSDQPLVLYAAGLAADFDSPAERGWLLEVERMTLRRAHVILVPDESLSHRLKALYGATIGEIRVVPAADEDAVQRVLSEVAQ
ncbi:glycosyltransferase family 4 protein [Hymenobacter terrenus]|uniref:glycosyltransferase family 4 protein n=1 Tax=Hymenobacter terrenus TaxID=1629124 RepID=UPI000619908C|nr:glycosyltransferase family 4 protein [Hymenobacter terrenus]